MSTSTLEMLEIDSTARCRFGLFKFGPVYFWALYLFIPAKPKDISAWLEVVCLVSARNNIASQNTHKKHADIVVLSVENTATWIY